MVRCVIFDLGNVVVAIDPARLYAKMAALNGLGPELVPRVRSTGLFEQFELGRLEPQEFARQLCAALNLPLTYEQFCELWGCLLLPDSLVPESLLESLARRYRLLLLSNTNILHYGQIHRDFPMLRHFHSAVLSYEVGCLKPHPAIYQEAIARSGCLPGECFYIDDTPAYVEGARRVGIDAVQFQSLEGLLADMRERAICL
jgi:putative hydrolase of the HAD superfamily